MSGLAQRIQGSMSRLGTHFHGTNTILIRPGTEGATTSDPIRCTTPIPWLQSLTPENYEEGDLEVFVSDAEPSLTFSPEPGHWAQLNSTWYRIESADKMQADKVIGYRLQLRGTQ